MIEHLLEVEDTGARHGVDTFQTQMEIVVLSLLDQNHEIALAQIAEARTISLDHVLDLRSASLNREQNAKAGRVAVAMLQHTFDRLRIVIEAPSANGSSGEHPH